MQDDDVGQGRNRQTPPQLVESIEPSTSGSDQLTRGVLEEAPMTHWHDSMVDRPEPDGPAYAAGWTVSGLAVLGAIVAVWVFGI
jgi:hypothetical protein